jgi:sigma-B regulation protein RsbU (phosphoserine phosphatase)
MSRELALLEKLEKELNLKELQIKSLLTITQAINDNVSNHGLFNMYRSFLSWEMGIDVMALFIKVHKKWVAVSNINFEQKEYSGVIARFLEYNRLHTIKEKETPELKDFDIIIPVYHKKQPIAYSLIGGIKNKDDLYNKIQFITTITNIIAVAIENKRLFKKQIEQERLKKEMELAGEVQKMLIPDELPQSELFELNSIYQPHSNIGGDYFDYIKFSEDKFVVCIADISGKGVAAALLMANFQAILRNLIFQYRDLETFVFALNQTVYRITKSDKFITFFIAEINAREKTMTYINAGHYPPVLFHDGKIVRLNQGCTVIGAFEKLPEITEEKLNLGENALIMSFTDGLPDLRNEEGVYFDDDMIERFVLKHGKKSAEEFNTQLMQDIDDFRGELNYVDDIAVLTCKIK